MANASVVTYPGRSILWSRMKGLGSEPLNIGWGTSAVTASANSDVNLFAPATETRVAGSSTAITSTQLADTYQVTGTLTCLVAGKTITEAGLFDTTTLSGTTTIASTISTNAQTSVTLGAATGPTTLNFYMQIGNEVVLVTGGQNTTTITFSRGQLGSTAGTSYPVGTPITVGGDGGARANFTLGGQTATVNAAAGGNMFAHADFGGIALNVNDSILFTWKDTLT
jgi:hypothetical protein